MTTHRVPCEDSDQTAWMRSLIRVFAGCTYSPVGNAVPQLIDLFIFPQRSWYVTEACLMKLLLKLNHTSAIHQEQPLILKLLDMMWGLMQVIIIM